MGVKEESMIADLILKKPSIPMDMEACKGLGGSSAPSVSAGVGVHAISEEVTVNDVQTVAQSLRRPSVSKQMITAIKNEADAVQQILDGNVGKAFKDKKQLPILPEDASFEQVVEVFFECADIIDDNIAQVAESAGRVGTKMNEKWAGIRERMKRFEFYFDRTMSKLEE